MIESRETLVRSRNVLHAHIDTPKPSFDTGVYNTHARSVIRHEEYGGYAFFGDKDDPRSEKVDAKGRIVWEPDT